MWYDSKKMEGGPVIDNWVNLWTPLLGKIDFTAKEAQHLTLEIRLAKTPPEVHEGWNCNQLLSTTIAETQAGARDVFGEIWTMNTLMTDADS